MNILYIHFFPFLKNFRDATVKMGLESIRKDSPNNVLRRQMYVYTTDEHSGSVCEVRQNASYIPLVP